MKAGAKVAQMVLITVVTAGVAVTGIVTASRDGQGTPAGRVASEAKGEREGQPCRIDRVARDGRFVRTTYVWEDGAPWRVSASGPGMLRDRWTTSVASTVSGTPGATEESLKAALGFSPTRTKPVTIRYARALKERRHYTLRIGRGFKQYGFDVYDRWGELHAAGSDFSCGPLHEAGAPYRFAYVGRGTASDFWTLTYRWTVAGST
ncbi:hypothetical protein [Actinomadura rubrisoli]|uniref:Uncharacterized protein n=1 Tax=Actinomadura rubrisoli TaxID=2530368 RepID=A0A4R5BJN6_9ACTN|nr:hypothetical protein [Actinomadura rubrisoli]TDD86968.1 hypothetical protein E1298_16800 [Actinomadura rubrisoli]